MTDINWGNSDNAIEFCALLEALRPGSYTPGERVCSRVRYFINDNVYSHDNNTGYLSLGGKIFKKIMLWSYLKNFPFGTIRDISFYLNCRFPRLAWPLRLPLSLIMIWEGLPGSKWSPWWIGNRFWIWLTYPASARYPLWEIIFGPQYLDNFTWYFCEEKKWDTVIEYHRCSMDSKLLNILRVKRLQMKWTAKILDWIGEKFYTYSRLNENRFIEEVTNLNFFTWIYFNKNDDHEIVKASIGKTYSGLIGEQNG